MKTYLKYLLILVVSFVAYLVISPLRSGFVKIGPLEGFLLSSPCYLLVYFFLTLFFLHKYGNQLKIWGIILLIFLGATHFELVWRIIHFERTLISLPEFLIRIYAILSGLIVYVIKAKKLKIGIAILLLAIGLWISYPGYKMWFNSHKDKIFSFHNNRLPSTGGRSTSLPVRC